MVKILDFWAPWCGPCRMMDPIIHEIEAEHKDLEIVKINVDEEPQKASEHQVMSIPTYIVIKGGQEVGRKVGFTPKPELLKLITE